MAEADRVSFSYRRCRRRLDTSNNMHPVKHNWATRLRFRALLLRISHKPMVCCLPLFSLLSSWAASTCRLQTSTCRVPRCCEGRAPDVRGWCPTIDRVRFLSRDALFLSAAHSEQFITYTLITRERPWCFIVLARSCVDPPVEGGGEGEIADRMVG